MQIDSTSQTVFLHGIRKNHLQTSWGILCPKHPQHTLTFIGKPDIETTNESSIHLPCPTTGRPRPVHTSCHPSLPPWLPEAFLPLQQEAISRGAKRHHRYDNLNIVMRKDPTSPLLERPIVFQTPFFWKR